MSDLSLDDFPRTREAVMEIYQRGVGDGMATALSLLLGREEGGVAGYGGRLNQSAEQWALTTLAAIREVQRP